MYHQPAQRFLTNNSDVPPTSTTNLQKLNCISLMHRHFTVPHCTVISKCSEAVSNLQHEMYKASRRSRNQNLWQNFKKSFGKHKWPYCLMIKSIHWSRCDRWTVKIKWLTMQECAENTVKGTAMQNNKGTMWGSWPSPCNITVPHNKHWAQQQFQVFMVVQCYCESCCLVMAPCRYGSCCCGCLIFKTDRLYVSTVQIYTMPSYQNRIYIGIQKNSQLSYLGNVFMYSGF